MYIHERKNWWQFRYDSDKILSVLSPIRARQGMLIGRLSLLGFTVQSNTALQNMMLDIVKSSEIEGEILNAAHVRSSIARRLGIEIGGEEQSTRYIDGIVDMMLDATQNYAQALTAERMFGWHNVLFPAGRSGLYVIEVAKYRTGEMQIVSGAMGKKRVHYQAPSPERVATEMERFIKWVNSSDNTEPIVKAAIAHLWFVSIHPFDDGNGRIARAITNMLMARSDNSAMRFYSISNTLCAHRKEYYDMLEAAQRSDGDITEWLLWFIQCFEESLATTEAIISSALSKYRFWDRMRNVEINSRQHKIINMLLDGFEGNLTTGRWSRICRCSRDTALKDATDLVDKGILLLGESRGRSTHYKLNPALIGR